MIRIRGVAPGRSWPWWVGPLLLVAMLAGACGDPPPEGAVPAPRVEGDAVVLDVTSPQMGALQIDVAQPRQATVRSFTGRLAWDEERTVRVYSPMAGRVQEILRQPGDAVALGDALAVVQSPDFAQVQAEERKAAANLVLATRTVERQRDLYAHGAGARQELEAAEDDYQSALSEVARSRSALAAYGGRVGRVDGELILTSPLAGVVVERNVTPGQQIRPDQMLASDPAQVQPLFTVSDPSHLWVLLDVAEADLAALQPGQALVVTSRAYPGREFPGRLDLIGASLDAATRTVKARGSVDNPDGLLKAEMYVNVTTSEPAPAVGAEIPVTAQFVDGDQHYVFVERAPGRFVRTPVRLGPVANDRMPVLEGLAPGERIVTRGGLLLQQILTAGSSG
ncbi:efflux RND transporter periplasmic adaptor subunit [bacterium]|nr:efflux RND transporter periplasmic adaptor subunit [bacterium]